MNLGKFAATISDRYIGVIQAFIDAGWEPVKLFTAPITSHMASNRQALALAEKHRIPIQLHRMDEMDLVALRDIGCDLLVVGSYQWKIGSGIDYLPRAINFHPAPLPQYRGPYPLVRGILDGCREWATTCHKLSADLDTGDILASRRFVLDLNESHESLDLKAQIETRQLARRVANDLESLWATATPQGIGNYVRMWTDADREIDFHQSVVQIDRQLRAFGDFECLVKINAVQFYVRRAICWLVTHDGQPGSVVHMDGSRYVIACKDGFLAILEWSLTPPGMAIESMNRHS